MTDPAAGPASPPGSSAASTGPPTGPTPALPAGSDPALGPTSGTPLARSTVVALVAEMALLISLGLVLSFGAPWPWWLIPGALLVTVLAIMGMRWRRYRRRQEAAGPPRTPSDRDRHEAI
ncbi:hypothetical protein [Nakamurella leprariae]|uniref:Uncharacterized protein n=1 Tax=Nakamurella leprariae TaxID=2803911 RepID=A0A938YEL7_9ACTN|nr:hypothetical protein [Nakamurella leprariae]MBM9468178.1 hypothetical protein [Nakamurella leprariae]